MITDIFIFTGGGLFGALMVFSLVFEEVSPREYFNFRHELRVKRAKELLKDHDA